MFKFKKVINGKIVFEILLLNWLVTRATNTKTRHTKHSKVISGCNIVHYVDSSCPNDISSMLMENHIRLFKKISKLILWRMSFKKVMLLQQLKNKIKRNYSFQHLFMVLWLLFMCFMYLCGYLHLAWLPKKSSHMGCK